MLRSLKYGLYGAVLAGVVGGTAAWQGVDKTVDLVVDGQARSVHTTAARVSDVLTATGYAVGSHDVVAPSLTAPVHDHSEVVLNRGRLLRLDVNGIHKDVWTTAPTVEAAMEQLGYSTANFTSVSRSQRLPLTPTDIAIRTPKSVTLVHDGRTETVSTTEATVGALLADLNIKLGGSDKVSPAPNSALTSGAKVVVQRIGSGRVTATKTLPYPTNRVPTSTLPTGTTQVVQA
ncbi:MAG: resuscitation-promoting factor RpfB, partial [Pseudonocardiales bacterium]|nr:resuscitation-promoting factor RpfB [Pseudonocardiales bacterium]